MSDDRILAEARAAFGHDGSTDVECLCHRIRQLERHSEERLELAACNAQQAQTIALLRASA